MQRISEPLSSCPTDNVVANDRRDLVLDGSVGAPSSTQRDAVRRAASCARAAAWLLTAASAIDATHRPTRRGCWPRPGDAQRAMGDLHGPPQAYNLYGAHSRACLSTADFALLVRHVRVG